MIKIIIIDILIRQLTTVLSGKTNRVELSGVFGWVVIFQLISMFIVAKSSGLIYLSYYFDVINKIIP